MKLERQLEILEGKFPNIRSNLEWSSLEEYRLQVNRTWVLTLRTAPSSEGDDSNEEYENPAYSKVEVRRFMSRRGTPCEGKFNNFVTAMTWLVRVQGVRPKFAPKTLGAFFWESPLGWDLN